MAVFKRYRVQFIIVGAVIAFSASLFSQCHRVSPKPHAEIPLHWLLAGLSEVGDIREEQFLYLPFDTHRPEGPPNGRLGPYASDVLSRAAQERLIAPQTLLLLRAYYSRAQLRHFATSYDYLLQRSAVVDSLRQRQRDFISMLSGRLLWGDGERKCLVGTLDAKALARIPVGAFYDLEDAALGTPAALVAPRLFTQDLGALHRLCVMPNPATTPGHVRMLQDTSIALSARLELSRLLELTPETDSEVMRSRDAVVRRRAARRDSVYLMLVQGATPRRRYEALDQWR